MDLLTVAHPLEQDKPNQEECGQDWEAGSLLAGGLVFSSTRFSIPAIPRAS
ncbi:MAG: hypothetical protein OXI46_06220 [Gemmatimonadota bacterium]|nr:hypothetical protein [Gemmatimonadota bacterium]